MNQAAEQHLAKAEHHLARGEEFYRKAAEEVLAAQKADPTLSNREVAERFDRSESWVRNLVRWVTTSHSSVAPTSTPYSGPEIAEQQDRAKTKKVLREASPEKLHSVLAGLPAKKVREIRKVAEEVEVQQHPGTAVKPPLGMPPPRKVGFLLEMGGPQAKLEKAIDEYVAEWEEHAPDAPEEELDIAREALAPKLMRLRMTVEEVVV